MKISLSRVFLVLALAGFAACALAQQYKWVDKNGKMQYGDTPPTGVKATPLRSPGGPAPVEPAPSSKDTKPAAKGPLTSAEKDAEFRKRQEDAEKAREKEAKAAEKDQSKRETCANAQAQLRLLESGQRVSRTDAKGERYFIEDEQRNAEMAKTRKTVQEWCN